jgi:hypothetical protein
MFQMHRVFCASPWELEAERNRFYQLIGQFNEESAMRHAILFVPVSLTSIGDKRPLQYAIDDNIRECRHYLLLLTEDWGPPQRNFHYDYELALQCADDPALPMKTVDVMIKDRRAAQSLPRDPASVPLPAAAATYSSLAEFDEYVNGLLAGWLGSLLAENKATSAGVG